MPENPTLEIYVDGDANPAVWAALARKGLTRTGPMGITLTVDGLNYDTGLSDRLVAASDH